MQTDQTPIEGFRVDDMGCLRPEQAHAVLRKGKSIQLLFLLPVEIVSLLQDCDDDDVLKKFLNSSQEFKSHIREHNVKPYFSTERDSTQKCLVMTSSFNDSTLNPDAPITISYENVHITAYTDSDERVDLDRGYPLTPAEIQTENAFNFMEKLLVKKGELPRRLENLGSLLTACNFIQQEIFSDYARQENITILQKRDKKKGKQFVVRHADELFAENAHSISTAPTRSPAAFFNWQQVLRDRKGGNSRGYEETVKLLPKSAKPLPPTAMN